MRTLLLTVATCLLALPVQAKYSGGSGTAQDPYQIATAADLIALGETPADYDKHFLLTADIDLDPNLPGRKVFDKAVIAPSWATLFTGVFDGNGHTISHLTIKGTDNLGLFGTLGIPFYRSAAEVRGVGLVAVNITGSGSFVGGLVGGNNGTVAQCYSTGAVNGKDVVGGLVGSVLGMTQGGRGTMSHCYSSVAVSGDSYVGGLVGRNNGTVTQCYSTGAVSGTDYVGGLVGDNWHGVTDCFWDIQTSGQTNSAGGIGKTNAQMHDPNTFRAAGWDFVGPADGPEDIWAQPAAGGYPILCWQLPDKVGLPAFSGGTGEPNDPYMISTAKDLNSIGHNPRLMKCHFRLVADLDLTGSHSYSIGSADYPYGGVFDGNAKTVRNLRNSLFGCVRGLIKDLRLVDPNCIGSPIETNEGTIASCSVQGGTISGDAGLVGYNSGTVTRCYSTAQLNGGGGGLVGWNYGAVTNCYSTGAVSSTGGYVGGLAGSNSGTVAQCYSTGAVSGGSQYVGGLAGYNSGTVTQSYSAGAVRGKTDIGGLVGCNWGTVAQCYSTGVVNGTGLYVGGLVGDNGGTVAQCYSTGTVSGTGSSVGGLVGDYWYRPGQSVIGCFWDIQTSGLATSAAGTGKTTAQMQTAKTFLDAAWDFVGETKNGTENLWWILEGKDYPHLWWEAAKK